ncbi:transposase [Flavivirga sp. MEBiC05379]|uniref:Transposase n=1 Tax=Flavivirga spongiicola TaxID=421621 RepID=A0ABU7XMK2_9FLAO
MENLTSDHELIRHCSMRLDILYFLSYNLDDKFPWHSNIRCIRQLFPEAIFETVFTHIFELCVNKRMVSDHTQAIDSVPIKASVKRLK